MTLTGILGIPRFLADMLYPNECPGCGRPCDRPGHFVCSECFSSQIHFFKGLRCNICGKAYSSGEDASFICGACSRTPPAYDKALSAVHFSGLPRDLIHRLKYGGQLWLAGELTDLLEACLRSGFPSDEIDAVLPVPLHRLRRRERTYNQAAVLAESLAKRIDRRFDSESLSRIRMTTTQTALDLPARRANLSGAFAVTRPDWVRDRTLLLVDDVMTTGSTLDACAQALKAAGAARVWAVSVARGTV